MEQEDASPEQATLAGMAQARRRVARVFLLRKGATGELEVLFGKPKGSSQWSGPGGKAEPGEHLFQAALREVKEETGLELWQDELRVA